MLINLSIRRIASIDSIVTLLINATAGATLLRLDLLESSLKPIDRKCHPSPLMISRYYYIKSSCHCHIVLMIV